MSQYASNLGSSGGSGSNASVGSTGAPAPTSATEVGYVNSSGNLTAVSPSTPLPITIQSQVGNTNVNVAQYGGTSTSLGQKTSSASQPVVIASDQSTLPISAISLPLPTGAATSALQTTGNTSLSTISSTLTNGTQVTTISGTVPLPTGASTAALQSNVQSAPGTAQTVAITIQGNSSGIAVPVSGTITSSKNTNGQVNNSTAVGTTAVTFTPPTNAVGFVVESESSNTVNLRYACGTTATTTVGMLLEPGRDSGYIPSSATVTVCAVSGSGQSASIQWVMSS